MILTAIYYALWTQGSQNIIDSGQNQLKYTYQPQQGDKAHHTKHTTTHPKVTLMLKHPSLQNKTSTVAMMHGPINIRLTNTCSKKECSNNNKCCFWKHSKYERIIKPYQSPAFRTKTYSLTSITGVSH